MIEDFKHMKWLPLAGGALLCVLGLTALVWPGRVAKILPLCIGAAILGLGLCEVASGFLAKSFLPEYIPGMRKLQGFVNVAVGLVFLLNRTLSLMFIAVVLGVWAVAFGALRLRDALRRRASGQPWGCCAGDAAVKFGGDIYAGQPAGQHGGLDGDGGAVFPVRGRIGHFFCGISRPAAP